MAVDEVSGYTVEQLYQPTRTEEIDPPAPSRPEGAEKKARFSPGRAQRWDGAARPRICDAFVTPGHTADGLAWNHQEQGRNHEIPQMVMHAVRGHAWDHTDPALCEFDRMPPT